ncbi:glycosyltransferase family 4 protein [Wenxinia marina]|uniref:Glycosyltransferase n=1 Tax=Wenxinia marina DSM 24838 TaxID=1123501 RepID=A0A0D0P870_9RHOB|nr:glycosyltransferase family 4 protein [Wenxinia marina]KIQ67771.1 Glycosyltransferase [Wenxinia marina DSM 24838]GGL77383.1 polysaccharide biosynthesis protein [Wenxinia marina]
MAIGRRPRLVVVNDATVARGGATGLALLQARLAAARGLEVVYFAGDRGAPAEFARHGITCLSAGGDELAKSAPLTAGTRGLYNRAARDLVRETVAATDTPHTVYHVHSFSKTLSPSIFSALRPVAHRTFVHAHDFFLACPNGGFMDYRRMKPCERVPLSLDCLGTNCDKRSYAQKLWRVARQDVLHRTMPRDAPWAGIVLLHPAMAPYMERAGYPPARLRTLRNPARALRPGRVEAERKDLFVFVGRVEAEKGVTELIGAAASAGVPLRVIGDGPLLPRLKAAHPEVDFSGWIDRDRIGEAIADARALVMPSRYPEPFGLVAAEASMSGLPVILSETALLAREVEGHGVGMTCDTRDPIAFASALRRMADLPPGDVAAMSRRGASGAAGLCTTPEEWIDGQIAMWSAAIGRTGPVPDDREA